MEEESCLMRYSERRNDVSKAKCAVLEFMYTKAISIHSIGGCVILEGVQGNE